MSCKYPWLVEYLLFSPGWLLDYAPRMLELQGRPYSDIDILISTPYLWTCQQSLKQMGRALLPKLSSGESEMQERN